MEKFPFNGNWNMDNETSNVTIDTVAEWTCCWSILLVCSMQYILIECVLGSMLLCDFRDASLQLQQVLFLVTFSDASFFLNWKNGLSCSF